jgi:hypothetical protein
MRVGPTGACDAVARNFGFPRSACFHGFPPSVALRALFAKKRGRLALSIYSPLVHHDVSFGTLEVVMSQPGGRSAPSPVSKCDVTADGDHAGGIHLHICLAGNGSANCNPVMQRVPCKVPATARAFRDVLGIELLKIG